MLLLLSISPPLTCSDGGGVKQKNLGWKNPQVKKNDSLSVVWGKVWHHVVMCWLCFFVRHFLTIWDSDAKQQKFRFSPFFSSFLLILSSSFFVPSCVPAPPSSPTFVFKYMRWLRSERDEELGHQIKRKFGPTFPVIPTITGPGRPLVDIGRVMRERGG